MFIHNTRPASVYSAPLFPFLSLIKNGNIFAWHTNGRPGSLRNSSAIETLAWQRGRWRANTPSGDRSHQKPDAALEANVWMERRRGGACTGCVSTHKRTSQGQRDERDFSQFHTHKHPLRAKPRQLLCSKLTEPQDGG